MRHPILACLVLLGACSGGVKTDDVEDPTAQNVAAAAANGTSARVAAATDCSNRPDFAPIAPGGQITTCVSGPDGTRPGHVSGTIVYMTDLDPGRAISWSRTQANASGLAPRKAETFRYEAGEPSQRSLMILAEPHQGRTRVTVNWGRPS